MFITFINVVKGSFEGEGYGTLKLCNTYRKLLSLYASPCVAGKTLNNIMNVEHLLDATFELKEECRMQKT